MERRRWARSGLDGQARHGAAWLGEVGLDLAWQARRGAAGLGEAWLGEAWLGEAGGRLPSASIRLSRPARGQQRGTGTPVRLGVKTLLRRLHPLGWRRRWRLTAHRSGQ